jgi:hypothetical protein
VSRRNSIRFGRRWRRRSGSAAPLSLVDQLLALDPYALWIPHEDLTDDGGGEASAVGDLTGNGRHLLQASDLIQPTINAADANFGDKVTLSFADNERMRADDMGGAFNGDDTAFDVIVVGKTDFAQGNNSLWSVGQLATSSEYIWANVNASGFHFARKRGGSVSKDLTGNVNQALTPHVWTWRHTGLLTTVESDEAATGIADGDHDVVGLTVMNKFTLNMLGAAGAEQLPGDHTYAAVAVWGPGLSVGDRDAAMAILTEYFDL